MKYIIYNGSGTILRVVSCPPSLAEIQAHDGEFIMEGEANDATQKIKFDGFDADGQPINPRVVDKTPQEIERDKPPKPKEIPFEKQIAYITNEQWQAVLERLKKLKTKA